MPPRSDILIALGLAVLGALEPTVLGSVEASPASALPGTVLAMAVLAVRRVAPGPSAAGVLAILAVQEFVATEPASGMAVYLAMLLSIGTLAASAPARDALAWGVATIALLGLLVAADRGADAGDFAFAGTMWLLAAGIGRALRSRELRAVGAEREARAAIEAERARLARELHDVVAHGLSVIHVQARVAGQVLADDPVAARRALDAIEETAHDALGDMRRMLELLRVEGEGARGPQPGIADLPALLERTRDAGLPVEDEVVGTPVPLPPGLDLAVYRIVQEGLTNVLKHAGPVPTRVRLGYRADAIRVDVVNEPGPRNGNRAGSGHGLAGMRERALLFGGTLEAGPRPEGGFRVQAELPL